MNTVQGVSYTLVTTFYTYPVTIPIGRIRMKLAKISELIEVKRVCTMYTPLDETAIAHNMVFERYASALHE